MIYVGLNVDVCVIKPPRGYLGDWPISSYFLNQLHTGSQNILELKPAQRAGFSKNNFKKWKTNAEQEILMRQKASNRGGQSAWWNSLIWKVPVPGEFPSARPHTLKESTKISMFTETDSACYHKSSKKRGRICLEEQLQVKTSLICDQRISSSPS